MSGLRTDRNIGLYEDIGENLGENVNDDAGEDLAGQQRSPASVRRRARGLFRFGRPSSTALDDKAIERTLTGGDIASTQPASAPARPAQSQPRQGLAFGLVTVALLGALTAWLGVRAQAADGLQHQRVRFLEAGRQSAIMLTTVKHNDVESDVKRILDSSTGAFLADFRNRSQSFVDTVKRTRSDTEGTIAEAGLESVHGDQADVLAAVSVKTSLAGVDSPTRLWRMRIAVQKIGTEVKLSNVEFIT